MTFIKLEAHQFEGPLDLLLGLIEERKLDITHLALAEVTEQFLIHVRSLEAAHPIILADYLAVAAKLLVIKSKAILPDLETGEEEIDAVRDLEQQLVLYKQFKYLARGLERFSAVSGQSFVRVSVFSQRINFFPDNSLSLEHLRESATNIIKTLAELDNLPQARVREAISIQEKITHLQNILAETIETRLSHVLAHAKTRHEAIVTFLALLELIKQRILTVDQEASFADITIRKWSPENVDMLE